MAWATAARVAWVPLSGLSIMKIVRDAVVADGRDGHAGRAQPRRVGFALVAQHVGLIDDHECRGKPGELLAARASTPVSGDAASGSWPSARSFLTSFDPIRPVPPITTIFMLFLQRVPGRGFRFG